MEKPTTEDVGREDLEVEAEPVSPCAGRSKEAHDFLRTGGADAGAGADEDAGAGVGAAEEGAADGGVGSVASRDSVRTTMSSVGVSVRGTSRAVMGAATPAVGSHDPDLDFTCEWAVHAAEMEVLEDRGEAGTGGVSETVEISVSDEETVSGRSLRGDSAGSEANFVCSSGAACVDEGGMTLVLAGAVEGAISAGFGDSGGVESWRAFFRTSGGGRQRGEKMMPGARDGSVGRRDQIAQPPNCCLGSDDVLYVLVDVDTGAGMGAGC